VSLDTVADSPSSDASNHAHNNVQMTKIYIYLIETSDKNFAAG
jgi:hypothetical protein